MRFLVKDAYDLDDLIIFTIQSENSILRHGIQCIVFDSINFNVL